MLAVEELETRLHVDGGVDAVDGISFDVERGETVCLVGESGSGKTLACDSITGLVGPPAEVSGDIRFDGQELLGLPDDEIRSIRGNRIAYLFQNPKGALDPVYTVGDQITEAITFHRDIEKAIAIERAVELLEAVGLSRPADRIDQYPHELSDGMCQRVALAIALAADPDLLIADEPTSALDVMIQARIIDLLEELQRDRELSVLLVTHDLRVAARLADRVVVLYDGVVVERGSASSVLERPAHPYTQALLRSFITDGDRVRAGSEADGCRFRRECPHAIDACAGDRPAFHDAGDDGEVACVRYSEEHDSTPVIADANELAAMLVDRRSERREVEDG